MSFWGQQRVLVTGGGGFIGTNVVEALRAAGCGDVFVARSRDYDLTVEENAVRLMEDSCPDIVIHLAGLVGGILANKERPADFFYRNLTMGTFVMHYSWKFGVRKLVAAAAGCGYPEHATMPLRETSFWDGYPQMESAPYSLAKRLLHVQAQAYYAQHRFPSVVVIPGNVYGPHDNFDLYQAHVIPALVRKFVEAVETGSREVIVWGSGRPTRDFVYVGDVARGILLAAEKCNTPELINLSSGVEHSISAVVDLLARITGFRGEIRWDTTRPDGQLRRWFDTRKAKELIGFEARVNLEEGLRRTVEWFKANRRTMAGRQM